MSKTACGTNTVCKARCLNIFQFMNLHRSVLPFSPHSTEQTIESSVVYHFRNIETSSYVNDPFEILHQQYNLLSVCQSSMCCTAAYIVELSSHSLYNTLYAYIISVLWQSWLRC